MMYNNGLKLTYFHIEDKFCLKWDFFPSGQGWKMKFGVPLFVCKNISKWSLFLKIKPTYLV